MTFPLESYCILKKLQNLTHLTLRERAEKRNSQRSLERTKRRHRNRAGVGEGWMSLPDLPHGIINFIWKEYLGKTREIFLTVKWVNQWRNPLKSWELEDLRANSTPNTAAVGRKEKGWIRGPLRMNPKSLQSNLLWFHIQVVFLEQKPWQTKQGEIISRLRDIYCQLQKMTRHKKLVNILNMSLYLL